MNMKKFVVWSLLLAAVVVAVAADASVDDKKEGAKQVEISTVEEKGEAKESLNQGNTVVETALEEEKDSNHEVDQRGRGESGVDGGSASAEKDTKEINVASHDAKSYGPQGGGWRGGGGGGGWRGGGCRGGGCHGGGWRGGGRGGGWRGGGGGRGWRGGGGGRGWRGGGGGGGGWRGGGGGGGWGGGGV